MKLSFNNELQKYVYGNEQGYIVLFKTKDRSIKYVRTVLQGSL